MFPAAIPTCSRSVPRSRHVPSRHNVLYSHPIINQMTSHLPAPFPSRGKQTGIFPIPSLRKTPPNKGPRWARRSYPVSRVPLQISNFVPKTKVQKLEVDLLLEWLVQQCMIRYLNSIFNFPLDLLSTYPGGIWEGEKAEHRAGRRRA